MSESAALATELRTLFAHLVAEAGGDDDVALTSSQRLALLAISGEPPLRLGELAERIGVSAATASRAVEALVVAGLAERVTEPADRRAVRIGASRAGRAYVEVRRARVVAELDAALQGFEGDEAEALLGLLQRLNAGLAGRPRDRPAPVLGHL